MLQIGLTRETVTLDPADQSLSAVRELVCSIVDQKVQSHHKKQISKLQLCRNYKVAGSMTWFLFAVNLLLTPNSQ